MLDALVIVFIMAYASIAFEQPIKINKSASALVGAGLLWTIHASSMGDSQLVSHQLSESLMATAQIVFFLMGAMIIVEVVDAHNGFEVITRRIRTSRLSSLMWLVGNVPLVAASHWLEISRGPASVWLSTSGSTERAWMTAWAEPRPAMTGFPDGRLPAHAAIGWTANRIADTDVNPRLIPP